MSVCTPFAQQFSIGRMHMTEALLLMRVGEPMSLCIASKGVDVKVHDGGYHREWQSFVEASGGLPIQIRMEEAAAFQGQMQQARKQYLPVAHPSPVFDAKALAAVAVVALGIRDLVVGLSDWLFDGDTRAWLSSQGRSESEQTFLEAFLSPRLLHISQQFCRPDFLIGEHGTYLAEVNFGTAIGGLALLDRSAQAFSESAFSRFLSGKRGYQIELTSTMPVWRDALKPLLRLPPGHVFFIAVADPDEVLNPRGHIVDFVDAVQAFGYEARLGWLQCLRTDDLGVYVGDQRVAVVYAMCTYREMVEHDVPTSLLLRLADLDAQERVDFMGSPANVLYDSKVNLALLTEAADAGRLPERAADLVSRYLPATYLLTPATAEQCKSDPSEWVLKPTDDYGGAKVIAGDAVSGVAWSEALERALGQANTSPYVVQRRVHPLWTWHDGAETLAAVLHGVGDVDPRRARLVRGRGT